MENSDDGIDDKYNDPHGAYILMHSYALSWLKLHQLQVGGHHGKCNPKLHKAAGRPVSRSPTSKCHREGGSLLQSGRSWQGSMNMNPCQAILKHVCV